MSEILDSPKSQESEIEELNKQEEQDETSCPLSSDQIPPLSEIDHLTGNCYCQMCTCGLHTCPGDQRRFPFYASNHFHSDYKLNFRRLDSGPQVFHKREYDFKPSPFAFDSSTTHRQDFLPFGTTPEKSAKPLDKLFGGKFVFKSTYQRDFPNWKKEKSEIYRRIPDKYRGHEIPMDCKSLYASDFKPKTIESKAPTEDPLKKSQKSFGVLSTSREWLGQSQSKLAYKAPIVFDNPFMFRSKSNQFMPNTTYRNNFSSTYRQDFKASPVPHLQKKKKAQRILKIIN